MRLLIDGHNLIGKLPDLSLADPDDERKLVRRLQIFAGRSRHRITVVFDPGLHEGSSSRESSSGVTTVYAGRGQTADGVIVGRVAQARNPRELTVITSDRELAAKVQVEGARVISSEEFIRTMLAPAPAGSPDEAEDRERAELHLSDKEVDAWMEEFAHAKRRKRPKDGSGL